MVRPIVLVIALVLLQNSGEFVMSTKLYLRYDYIGEHLENSAPPDVDVNGHLPVTPRGTWANSSTSFTMTPTKFQDGGWSARTVLNSSAANPTNRVFGYWCSPPLDSNQTISGTLDLVIGIVESAAAANNYWRVYAWVRKPDGTVRGTLLTAYEENTTNEFPTTATVASLQSPQALSAVSALAGDRIIVEIGYISRNADSVLYSGKLYIGTSGFDAPHTLLADAAVGGLPGVGSDDSFAGYVLLSGTYTFDEEFDFPVLGATPITTLSYADTKSAAALDAGWPYRSWYTTAAKVESWYAYTPTVDSYVGVAAISDPLYPAGNYQPRIQVWSSNDASNGYLSNVNGETELTNIGYAVDFLATAGTSYLVRARQDRPAVTPLTAGLSFTADAIAPVVSRQWLIVQDDTDPLPAIAIDIVYGTILGTVANSIIPAGESAAILTSGIAAWGSLNGTISLVAADLTQIALINLGYSGSLLQPYADRTNGDKFYVLYVPVGAAKLSTITTAGVLSFEIVTLPANSTQTPGFAVSRDNTTLYYADNGTGDLHVYDLVGHAALADIPNPNPGYLYCRPVNIGNPGALLVMSDGTLVFKQFQPAGSIEKLVQLAANGSVLHNYSYDNTVDGPIDQIDSPSSDDPDIIWVWRYSEPFAEAVYAIFQKVRLSTGGVLVEFQLPMSSQGIVLGDQQHTGVLFGPSVSCDFLVHDPTPPRPPDTTPPSPPGDCCQTTTGAGSPGVTPLPDNTVLAGWLPSCIGGGIVPSAADLTNSEAWDPQ